jgi:membrane protein implicated in regulation of membrane protease activity
MQKRAKKQPHKQIPDRVKNRRARMLINASPNFFFSLFGIAYVVKEYGWSSLFSLPYIILVIWLIWAVILVFLLRWNETNRETLEDKLEKLITELREDRIERNNRDKKLPPIE